MSPSRRRVPLAHAALSAFLASFLALPLILPHGAVHAALAIGPIYQWHTFYGSSDMGDFGSRIAIDNSGNVYVVGQSYAPWWGDNNAVPLAPHVGENDVLVVKLDSSGAYQWHTYYGSFDSDGGTDIAVDSNGNVYVAGTSCATWPLGVPPRHTYSGLCDLLVLKLNSNGTYGWHTFYGSSSNGDTGMGIALDSSDNLYVVGSSMATWQGDSAASPLHAHSGSEDMVVLKLDSDGVYQWHTFYGGSSYDIGSGISVDDSGNVYAVGDSSTSWLGDGGAAPLRSYRGGYDLTVVKLSSSGGYQWHTFIGSNSDDFSASILMDPGNGVYISGTSHAPWLEDGIPPLHFTGGGAEMVLVKLDSDGAYRWHTLYGSSGYDRGRDIAVDNSGSIYMVGYSDAPWQGDNGTDPLHAHSGFSDMAVMKLDGSGAYQYHTFYGSIDGDSGIGISLDDTGSIYVTGHSQAAWQGDLDTSPLHPHAGTDDIVVLKLAGPLPLSVSKDGAGSGLITSEPPGIACDPDCAETYDYGTVVTLTATADPGSTFAGWSGACSGTSLCRVTMDREKNLTALFNVVYGLYLPLVLRD